jgi:DNA-binding transcriptional LysR family regulator
VISMSERRARAGCDWQAIEVRHLAALAAVADEGSFRRAADRLGYVQSAISGQIAHLERAVGARLLSRASGTPVVELTAEGDLLLRHTTEILSRFQTARADVSSLARRASSVLRVVGFERFAPRRVAGVLSRFRQQHPFARVVLEQQKPGRDVAELLHEDVDLLICELAAVPNAMDYEVLDSGGYALLVSSCSVLAARRQPLTARALAGLRPIVPAGCEGRGLDLQLRNLDVVRHPCLQAESVATARSLVASGLGEAIVPSRLVDGTDPRVVALDLGHLLPPYVMVAVCESEHRTPIIEDFIRTVREMEPEDGDAMDTAHEPVGSSVT